MLGRAKPNGCTKTCLTVYSASFHYLKHFISCFYLVSLKLWTMKAYLSRTFYWGCRELLKTFRSLKKILLWKKTQHPWWQIRCSSCKWQHFLALAVCSPASHHAADWRIPLKAAAWFPSEWNVGGSNGGLTQEQASYEHACYPSVSVDPHQFAAHMDIALHVLWPAL